ncbi:MAG: hypothetical protein ACPGLY_25030 [Rubripirellula sp.]
MFTHLAHTQLICGFLSQINDQQAKIDSPGLGAARVGMPDAAEHAKSLGEMTLSELFELGQYQVQSLIQGGSIDRLRWILIGALSLLVLLVGISLLSALLRKLRPKTRSSCEAGQQRPDMPRLTSDMLGNPGSLGFIPLGLSLDHLQQSSSSQSSSNVDEASEINALQTRLQSLEKMLTDLSQQANRPSSENRGVQGNACASPTSVKDNSRVEHPVSSRVEHPVSGDRLPAPFARDLPSSSSSHCGTDKLGQGRSDDPCESDRTKEPDQLSLDILAENLPLREAVSSNACKRFGDHSDLP